MAGRINTNELVPGKRLQIFFILIFFFSAMIFGQDMSDADKKLKDEFLAGYKSNGEEGLRNLAKNKKDSITLKFISAFGEAAVKEKNEEWFKVCTIIAEEKADEKITADVQGYVLYGKGEVHFNNGDNAKAGEMYDKALPLFEKAGDHLGQGMVYKRKGDVFFNTGEHGKAGEMYDKAVIFYEKAGKKVDF